MGSSNCPAVEAAFEMAAAPRTFSFPADHASHHGYQTEWWYFTGQVHNSAGREFGYQFTIFRRELDSRKASERGRTSAWAASDFYLLHLAVTDIQARHYIHAQDLGRGALKLAGATDVSDVKPKIEVWTKESRLTRIDGGWTMSAITPSCSLYFSLRETMPPILHGSLGEEGLSRKGPERGQASYYYSVPFLRTTGKLTVDGKEFEITGGNSWMDHEFGSNQLSAVQSGWNWFALQLENGPALMLYVLRNKDNTIDPHSSGTWIEPGGKSAHLNLDEFELKPGRIWHSDKTGADYPVEWIVDVPSRKAKFAVQSVVDDQEFQSQDAAGLHYYEGAISVRGTIKDAPVKGSGYLEITGGTLGGRL